MKLKLSNLSDTFVQLSFIFFLVMIVACSRGENWQTSHKELKTQSLSANEVK
ncbi:MAG: hypothetical protein ISR65_04420 [Bacteriovoracaceae bacterium]|nr:hypothetical protein [Bacteriovoracaceae bacterium]